MAVNSVNASDVNTLLEKVKAQQSTLQARIDKAKADYGDDKLFNASSEGSSIGETDLTMDKINSMSYTEIQALLTNTPSDAQINAELEASENELAGYLEEYEKLCNEIKTLQSDIEKLNNTLTEAQNEKAAAEKLLAAAQRNKEQAEEEVADAQKAYESAKRTKERELDQAEDQAYEDAMKAYSEQEANEELEDDKRMSFNDILLEKRRKLKCSDSYDNAIADAASNLASKKAAVKRFELQINTHTTTIEEKTSLITRTQNSITQKEAQLAEKETSLNTVSANIEKTQANVNNLEAKMATRNFINQNQTEIDNVAYEKNPETIQARADINSAEKTVADQLAIAQAAEKAADAAAKDGDQETANAKKAEAEAAKKAAEEAQKKADEAKAKLRDTDSAISKISTINDNMTKINTSVTNAVNSSNNVDKAVADMKARRDASVSYTTYTDAEGNTVEDKTKFDLTKMINASELALAKSKNIDLSECVKEGDLYYPKYIIAKGTGKTDDGFHIYERQNKNRFTSIARLYADNKGFDICANGNGYMAKQGDSENYKDGFTEVYYIVSTCTSDADFENAKFGCTYKKYNTCSPLSLDLNGDGVKVSDEVVDFDIDGDGKADKINNSADAVLCFDKDGNGIAGSDGSECFGNNTDLDGDGKADGYKDGFEALKALAQRENLINNDDDTQLDENDIKFLEMNFGFKVKTNGYNSEAKSLLEMGISAINLSRTSETNMFNVDTNGNQLMTQEGATFVQNGEVKEYADIWHRKFDDIENPFAKIA